MLDVSNAADAEKVANAIVTRHGRIDCLVNSAGLNVPKRSWDDVTTEGWDKVVDINLSGVMYCMRAALPAMRAQKDGIIINVASWAGRHVSKMTGPAYTATKHAVTGITKTAALDGRKYGIAVGQIDIGNVASDMTARMVGGVPQADGSIKPEPRMAMDNVVATFMTMAKLPLEANILNVTVMATTMPYVGRG